VTSGTPSAPPPGTTVTLQVETPVGSIGVVGVVLAADSSTWSVRRRDGSVIDVDVGAIRASRVVPPGRAERATVEEVQRIGALGWRALEQATVGDWLLRASGGFTGRANSALALGVPGRPLDEAIDAVEAWYADRDLPTRIQLVDRDAPSGLADRLDARGWGESPDVYVMTAELGHVLRAAPTLADLEVRVDTEPDDTWLSCYRQDGVTPRTLVREILTNHPAAVFASLREGGRCVAIARGCVDDRWAGIHAVEVVPSERGRGLGAIATAAALRWCGQRGARRTYLQVSVDNTPAVQLYERLNFGVHHHYRYREGPTLELSGSERAGAG
jgi:ribosomal protein S18 acetylase RimI-like enzyme